MPRAAAARGRKPLHSPNRIQQRTSPQRNSDSAAHARQGHAQPLLSHCRTAVTLAALSWPQPLGRRCRNGSQCARPQRGAAPPAQSMLYRAPHSAGCAATCQRRRRFRRAREGSGGGAAPDRCMAGTTRSRAAPAGARRTCASHLCQSAGAIRPPAECGAPIVPNCTTLTVGRMHARRAECGVQYVLTACGTCVLC